MSGYFSDRVLAVIDGTEVVDDKVRIVLTLGKAWARLLDGNGSNDACYAMATAVRLAMSEDYGLPGGVDRVNAVSYRVLEYGLTS